MRIGRCLVNTFCTAFWTKQKKKIKSIQNIRSFTRKKNVTGFASSKKTLNLKKNKIIIKTTLMHQSSALPLCFLFFSCIQFHFISQSHFNNMDKRDTMPCRKNLGRCHVILVVTTKQLVSLNVTFKSVKENVTFILYSQL